MLTKIAPLFAHTDVGTAESEEVMGGREGSGSGFSHAVAETFRCAHASFPVETDSI